MKMFRCNDAAWLLSVVSMVLVFLALYSDSYASGARQLWQSRDQFVALERQDQILGGNPVLNSHPAEISPDRLTAVLASIELKFPDSRVPERLFTNQSLEVLVPEIVQGFKKATPGEDVVFAVIGLHKTLLGFAKSPKVTTGRVFFMGGRLNLIVGFAQKEFNEREDRRLSPFIPGSRLQASEGEWVLQPQPGQKGFELARKDWMVFSDEWRAPAAPVPAAVQNAPSAQTTTPQPVRLGTDTRTPTERLTILKELKEKGLISEEEYSSKRREILNGL